MLGWENLGSVSGRDLFSLYSIFFTVGGFYVCFEIKILEERWALEFRVLKSCSPGQNILNKIEKSSKIGQDKKILIYTFACFF